MNDQLHHPGGESPIRVILIHLPKTAGTSLTDLLEAEYGRVFRVDGHRLAEQAGLARAAERAGVRAFAGHMPYGLGELLREDYVYITLLRDPLERIMSHYHAARRHPDQPLGRELHAEQMSIRDYVVRHSARCWFNNGQTRLIGGTWSDPEASADQGALTRAKQNLSRFAVAGTSERFDASLALIRRRLGWVGRDYKRRNLASRQVKAEALDQRTRAEIAHRNSLDMELHAWVSQRLQRELIEERVAA